MDREKNTKLPKAKEKVIERIKEQLVIPDKKLDKIRFDFTPKCVSGEDVLQVTSLKKHLEIIPFLKASFNVKRGERVFLLGVTDVAKPLFLKFLWVI